jgi:hypothetical protein
MKTNRISILGRLTGIGIALALFAGAAVTLKAEEIQTGRGAASKLLELTGRSAVPKPGTSDYKPMSCVKCKDSHASRMNWSARGANKPTITVARHLCDGCSSNWVVSGHGKAKTTTAVHASTSCGAESLVCCSTSRSGIAATGGMEKKFEVAPVKQETDLRTDRSQQSTRTQQPERKQL